jgi:hypothetical protein
MRFIILSDVEEEGTIFESKSLIIMDGAAYKTVTDCI